VSLDSSAAVMTGDILGQGAIVLCGWDGGLTLSMETLLPGNVFGLAVLGDVRCVAWKIGTELRGHMAS